MSPPISRQVVWRERGQELITTNILEVPCQSRLKAVVQVAIELTWTEE